MTRRVAGGIAGAAGLIAVLTLLARVAGFGRTLVFADSVRASGVGAVYNIVNAVPNVVHEVAAGGALAAVTVPLIASHLGRGERDEAHAVASTLLTWALIILTPLAALVWFLAEPISGLLVPDRIPEGVSTGASMLRIFSVQIPLYGLAIVVSGLLHAYSRFAAVAVAPLVSSVIVMATYAAYGSLADGATTGVGSGAIQLLAWGTTAGVAALALPLLIPAWRSGWRYRPSVRFVGDDATRARRLAGAGLIALAAQQLATLASLRIAATYGGGEGAASVYTWILAVVMLPYAVLVIPLATAAFPALATRAAAETDRAAEAGDSQSSPTLPSAPPSSESLSSESLPSDSLPPDSLSSSSVSSSSVPSSSPPADGEAGGLLGRAFHVAVLLGIVAAVGLIVVSPLVGAVFSFLDARRGGGTASGAAVPAMAAGLRAFAPGLIGFGVQALLTRALYVRGRPLTAGLAVALGWAIAVVVPAAALSTSSGAQRTVLLLGTGWSIGMTVAALLLIVLAVRHWGSGILRGWSGTVQYLRRRVVPG